MAFTMTVRDKYGNVVRAWEATRADVERIVRHVLEEDPDGFCATRVQPGHLSYYALATDRFIELQRVA